MPAEAAPSGITRLNGKQFACGWDVEDESPVSGKTPGSRSAPAFYSWMPALTMAFATGASNSS
jgi:hypothetical protein